MAASRLAAMRITFSPTMYKRLLKPTFLRYLEGTYVSNVFATIIVYFLRDDLDKDKQRRRLVNFNVYISANVSWWLLYKIGKLTGGQGYQVEHINSNKKRSMRAVLLSFSGK